VFLKVKKKVKKKGPLQRCMGKMKKRLTLGGPHMEKARSGFDENQEKHQKKGCPGRCGVIKKKKKGEEGGKTAGSRGRNGKEMRRGKPVPRKNYGGGGRNAFCEVQESRWHTRQGEKKIKHRFGRSKKKGRKKTNEF